MMGGGDDCVAPPLFFRLENASDYARRRGNARFRFLRRWMRDDALAQVNNTRHRRYSPLRLGCCWWQLQLQSIWPSNRLSIDTVDYGWRERDIFWLLSSHCFDSARYASAILASCWPVHYYSLSISLVSPSPTLNGQSILFGWIKSQTLTPSAPT